MPAFSRKRLACFYCGKRSIQRYEYGLPKWKCEHCEAVNYLDAHGEITEPPAQATPFVTRTERYAQAIPRSISPKLPDLQDSPFCQTCLNNQHLVTQNLANYLPDTTDPRYYEFEANLPKYKKELEERYPQVCVDCEPKVKERMRAAGAVAKADYLGRMMDKTRRIGLPRSVWTPIYMLSTIGGLIWFLATVLLVLWNTFGVLADHTLVEAELSIEDLNLLQCLGQAGAFARVDTACMTIAQSLAGWGTVAGLLSLWWNPVMCRRNIDRTIGLSEFYKLQFILQASRCGTWYFLENENALDPSIIKLVHATMLGLNILVPILSYSTTRIAKTPKISFQDDNTDLQVSTVQKQARGVILQTNLPEPHSVTTSTSVSFPYSKISNERVRKQQSPPIVAHEDVNDADAMDIDSPQPKHGFRPTTFRNTQTKIQEPSPFYGKLPPAPVSQEHRLRNPPNKPSFQKTSSERQEKFFQSMTRPQSGTIEKDTDYAIDFRMRGAKLQLTEDHQETGLEGWFSSNVFSLGESGSKSNQPPESNTKQDGLPMSKSTTFVQVIPIILLISSLCAWSMASRFQPWSIYIYYAAAGLGAVVAGTRLLSTATGPVINGSDILLCTVELFGAAALGYQIQQAVLTEQDVQSALGSFPLLYLGFMIIQECMVLFTMYRQAKAGLVQTATQPPAVSMTPFPREKTRLPFDNGTPIFNSRAAALIQDPPTPVERLGITTASPGPAGLGGLNLGLGGGTIPQSNAYSASQRTRALKARAPKPWEVGGV